MIFDGHSDIWTDVTIHALNGERNILKRYHLDRLKAGQIEGSIFVIWVDPPHDKDPVRRMDQVITAIKQEIEECSEIAVVHNYQQLMKAKKAGKFYILIGIEGLSGIDGDLDKIDLLYDLGARHAMLTWNEQNALGTGVQGDKERGLTALGKEAVRRIVDKKMIMDVSHLNDKSFWDVVNLVNGPIIASHSNARALCPVARNLTDEQLLEIRNLNGVVGMNSFNLFVHKDIQKQTIDNFVNHIIYVTEKIGVEHVGFGFDFFEFLPTDSMRSYSDQETPYTTGLEDCTKVIQLLNRMRDAGFTDKEVQMISRQNWHRVIKHILG